jgi:hypothetical protein
MRYNTIVSNTSGSHKQFIEETNNSLIVQVGEKVIVFGLVLCGAMCFHFNYSNVAKLVFLLGAGVIAGTYNGLFNDYLWREETRRKKNISEPYPIPYIVHTVFNHIISGIVAGLSLYFLLNHFYGIELVKIAEEMRVSDFVFFLISITGYSGLLPRTFWYGSYGATLKKDL